MDISQRIVVEGPMLRTIYGAAGMGAFGETMTITEPRTTRRPVDTVGLDTITGPDTTSRTGTGGVSIPIPIETPRQKQSVPPPTPVEPTPAPIEPVQAPFDLTRAIVGPAYAPPPLPYKKTLPGPSGGGGGGGRGRKHYHSWTITNPIPDVEMVIGDGPLQQRRGRKRMS